MIPTHMIMLTCLIALAISLLLLVALLAFFLFARKPRAILARGASSLRARIHRAIDILLYRDYYAVGPTLQRFSQELALLRDQEGVISLLLDGLTETLGLTGIAFVPMPEGLDQNALSVIEPDDLRARAAFATPAGRVSVLRGLAMLDISRLTLSWQSPLLRDPWPGCAAILLIGQAGGDESAALLVIGPKRSGGRLWRDDQAILETLAHQAATALANALLVAGLKTSLAQVRISTEQLVQARAEQQMLLRELVDADERQRAALARDLHDDALQEVLYLMRHSRLCAELAESLTRAEVAPLNGQITPNGSALHLAQGSALDRLRQELRQLTERSSVVEQKLRSLYLGLYPALLPSLGLPAALEDLAREMIITDNIDISVACDDDTLPFVQALDPETALHIYRIAQEALRNVGKHAGPCTATLHLSATLLAHESLSGRRASPHSHHIHAPQHALILEVIDTGQGMPLPVDYAALLRDRHLGLAGMRERAERIGGALEMAAAPAGGARIRLTVPLSDA